MRIIYANMINIADILADIVDIWVRIIGIIDYWYGPQYWEENFNMTNKSVELWLKSEK